MNIEGTFSIGVMRFREGHDDPDQEYLAAAEITEWGDVTEIAWDEGKHRYYLRFRQSDLLRGIREKKS